MSTLPFSATLKSLVIGSVLVGLASTANAQFNPNVWYRFTTQFKGPNVAMDVYNGGPLNNEMHMTAKAPYTGQFWKIRPFGPAAPGYYRISCLFRGDDLPIDVFNGGPKNNQIHLTKIGPYTGQAWKITPIPQAPGHYRLTTLFRGPGFSLEGFAGSTQDRPTLVKTGLFTGQAWKLIPIAGVNPPKVSTFAQGCAGGLGVHTMSASLPWAGEVYRGTITRVPATAYSRILFGRRSSQPLDLTPFGSPGCLMHVPLDMRIPGQRSGSNHVWALTIPRDPSLVNLRLQSQAFIVDSAAAPRLFTTSNGLDLTIGMR